MSNDNNENKNKIRRKTVSSSNNKANPSSNKTSSSRSKKKKDKFKTLRVAGILILVLLVVASAAGTGIVFASLKNVQPVTKALLDEKTYQTTKIYYSNGKLLSNAPSVNKKEPIAIEDMPDYIKKAIVAIEDERFYEHNGVDIKGLLRSVVKTLSGKKQGGSTIPMQVSKMLLTSHTQSIPRKIQDIYYAYEMSKTLSKDEILEAYLNNFFVGKGLAGVQAGARGYFDKDATKSEADGGLTLAECALLAGATKFPEKYSAYKPAKLDGNETKEDVENRLLFYVNTADDNLDDPTEVELRKIDDLKSWDLISNDMYNQLKAGSMVVRKAANNPDAKKRQEVVLKKMLDLGVITQAEHDKAVAEEIKIKLPKSAEKVSSSVEDLIEYDVIDALIDQGNTREEAYNLFYNGGLQINTTIDPNMQDSLEEVYDNDANFPASRNNGSDGREEAYNLFYNGGLQINTTIDPNMQDSLEEVYDNDANFPASRNNGSDGIIQPQSAMVILDYRTGNIKALIGGRHIKGRKGTNRATEPRQPGSTIKPLSIYTPVIDTLEQTQADAYSDAKGGYQFRENNKWNPNTTTKGSGSMSLRLALAKSSNTIAVKAAETLGSTYEESIDIMIDYLKEFGITTVVDSIDIMIDYLKEFGITTVVDTNTADQGNNDRTYPALTLGGMTTGISPLEMAAAYGTLANAGTYIEPTIFTTITSYDGQLIVKNTPEEHKVVAPEVAYVLTDMLQAVVTEGTGGSARLTGNAGGMKVAGKTGTTNAGLDAWFVGYTPYYVGATYLGDDGGRKNPETGKTIVRQKVPGTSGSAAKLWSKVMSKVHGNLDKIEFKKPENIYFTKINLYDGGKSSSGSNAAFVSGTYPRKGYTSYSNNPAPSKKEEEEKPATPDAGDGDTPPDNGGDTKPTTPDNGDSDNKPTTPDNGGSDNKPTTPDNGDSDNKPSTPDNGGSATPDNGDNTPQEPTQ